MPAGSGEGPAGRSFRRGAFVGFSGIKHRDQHFFEQQHPAFMSFALERSTASSIRS